MSQNDKLNKIKNSLNRELHPIEYIKKWWAKVDKAKLKDNLLKLIPFFMVLLNGIALNHFAIIGQSGSNAGNSGINDLLAMAAFSLFLLLPIGYIAANILETGLLMFFFILNEYVSASRGRPLNFNDIYCVQDAMAVSSKYPFEFTDKMMKTSIIAAGLLIFTTLGIIFSKKKFGRHKLKIKTLISGGMMILTLLNITISAPSQKELIPWDEPEYVRMKGLFSALFSEYLSSRIEPPEGYDKSLCEDILSSEPTTGSPEDMPVNVILIMNESLADYSLIYDIYENGFSSDPLPGIHALSDNCAKGRMAVNIFGSSTCNSEFESLTGYSIAFLPQRSMPYVQYSLVGLPNIAKDFASLGFAATPLHGYYGQEYKRETIYSDWFTDPMISAEKFSDQYVDDGNGNLFDVDSNFDNAPTFGDDLEYVNRFISDAECFRKTFDKVKEDNAAGKSSFMFDVTIQNHGGYIQYTGDYDLINYTDDDQSNVYLSLSHISDKAFTDFLEELRNYPQKTVVIMFGDHQPSLFFELLRCKTPETNNEYEANSYKYTVPYIMWANYDMEWDVPEYFSLSYLPMLIKKNIGMPLDAFDQAQLRAMEDFPVISYEFACNSAGEFVAPDAVNESENVRTYRALQYYEMFDN